MDKANLVVVEKLKGENWTTWKFQTIIALKAKRLFEITMGGLTKPDNPQNAVEDWIQKDAKAQEIITARLEEKPLTHVLACDTAKEMWDKLKSIYEHQSDVSIHLLQQRFFRLEFGQSSVSEFISKIEDLRGKLKQLNEEISEKMVITKILMSLPSHLQHFVSAWESVDSDKQSLTELTSRLLIEEERSTQKVETTALVSKTVKVSEIKCFGCNKSGHIKKDCEELKKKKCLYCKKIGHVMKDCWFMKKKKEKGEETSREKNANAFLSLSSGQDFSELSALILETNAEKDDWFMDTGASDHMCYEIHLFEKLINQSEKRQIKIGNGTRLDVHGTGQIKVEAWNGRRWIRTVLNDVMYVPELKVNLFSAGKVLDKGFTMNSDKDKCQILDSDGDVRAEAERNGKLFKMKFRSIKDEFCNVAQSSKIEDVHDWHCKLAHINHKQVKSFLKSMNIKFTDNKKSVCTDCLKGKQHRQPFPMSDSHATKTCELFHSDLCGPFETESLGGAKYYLLLKDDFSKYRFVRFLKTKNETCENIEAVLNIVQNQSGNSIKKLRSDNGLEFVNEQLHTILEKKGISHEKSCPYTPEQNGRAERENRTLVESARTLLHSKNLPKKLWAEAINYAAFVVNRVGKSSLTEKTPFELWTGKKCNVGIFHEFGSKVAVHIPKQKRRKLDSKSESGIFVGYSEEVKGYRIYFPHRNKVEIHRDVVFIPEKSDTVENTISPETIVTVDISDKEENDNNEILEERQERNIDSDNDDEEIAQRPNEHQFHERTRRERREPNWLRDYETNFYSMTEEPLTYEEAVSGTDSEKWKEAMKQELKVLSENNTWSEVLWPVDKNQKVIESKWVFKVKNNNEFKARLVARGFQQECKDMYDIYAPVAKLTTFRMLLSIANMYKLTIFQLDVRSAFLYGEIGEEVYMSLPGKNKSNSKTVCKLNKSIYGLKKSPKCWNTKFDCFMKNEGFTRSLNDYCLYSKSEGSSKLIVLVYVDDLLITGTDLQQVENFKIALKEQFNMKDLGKISQYLGIDVNQNFEDGYTELSQSKYLEKVLDKFGMSNCKPIETPMDSNLNLELFKSDVRDTTLETKCRQIIGSLMYAVLGTRPDLCESVSLLSLFQDQANNNLYQSLKRILRYIKHTINLTLKFKQNNNPEDIIIGFVDSDWGGDTVDRKSTTGIIFKLFNNPIMWSSKKQQCVSLSSTESEYIALSAATAEACWLRKLIVDFNLCSVSGPIKLYEDNQSAIRLANNPENNRRVKHIDIKFHFVKEKLEQKLVDIVYVKTENQLADMFTKPLAKIKFVTLRNLLNLEEKKIN